MRLRQKPQDYQMERKFGRLQNKYDARDLRLGSFLTQGDYNTASEIKRRLWSFNRVLDQGETPHCVGFAWAQFGNCEPVNSDFSEEDAHSVYYKAKEFDGEPSEENGSTTRSGVKAMKSIGRVNGYAFASSIKDIETWVLCKGTVVTGTGWTTGMSEPDENFFIHPTGEPVGGHEYLIVGADSEERFFTVLNSWGENWGNNGTAKIS